VEQPIVIRTRRPGDAGYIVYRHGVLYEREYGLDQVFEKYVLAGLLAFLENPAGGEIWMAECDNKIAGFIAVVGIDPQTAQLRWFLLEPEFRGQGLGHRLMTTLIDFCRQQNYRHIFLWTFQGLDAARHLYERFGFRLTEEKPNNTWKNQLTEQRWDLYLDGK
jgi:GNAT superfamily N-acetyltransferase